MQKIRTMIAERNKKIREMNANYEPSKRIELFKEESLDRIRAEYQKSLEEMKTKVLAEKTDIENEYWYNRPSLEKQAQYITIAGIKYHSMTDAQLKKAAEDLQNLPPELIEIEEARTIASQLRSRNAISEADRLATFTEIQNVAQPYTHYPAYQAAKKTLERLKVYESKKDMFVLGSDPNAINEGDIVQVDALEKEG